MNSIDPHLPALVVIAPLLVAPLTALLRQSGLAWLSATAASLFSVALSIRLIAVVLEHGPLSYAVGSWPAPYGIGLSVDAFSALLLLIVSGASSVALLIARNGLDQDVEPHQHHLFYAVWLLALAGLTGIVVSADAFNIFVFMEISSLATYILIAGGRQRQALTAVFKYLILGTIGATFYLIGVGLIYMMTGTLNLNDMASRVADVTDTRPILVASGFITVGLALKAAVFPLHTWLPKAYTFSPHVVTVFIAACSTKVALYVLLRFDFLVFQGNLPLHGVQFSSFMLPLGILAILVASVLALLAQDLKRLLAYSSVAQIGYILVGVSLMSVTGLTAGIVHLFNHALAKGTLFIAVACLATAGAGMALQSLGGIARKMPLTMAAFVVAGLSLIGIPGTAGFTSKWYLVVAAMELGPNGVWLVAPVLVGALMAVLYIWRVVEIAYFKAPVERSDGGEAPWPMLAVLWLAVLANIYFGLQPALPLNLAGESAVLLLESATR